MEQSESGDTTLLNVDDTVQNFLKMCRICFGITDLKNLHKSKFQDTSLNAILEKCTGVIAMENDGLPPNVCTKCITELIQSVVFRTKCINADNVLTKLLVLSKVSKKTPLRNQNDLIVDFLNKFEFNCIECEKTFESSKLLENHKNKEHEILKTPAILNTIQNTKQLPIVLKITNPMSDDMPPLEFQVEPEVLPKTEKRILETLPKRHMPIYRYKCDRCSCYCRTEAYLNKHINVEHLKNNNNKTRNFLCAICGKTFYSNNRLKAHNVVHTKTRDFKCDYCQKQFAFRANLIRHQTTHTDVKPFICEYCGKTFTQKSSLTVHYSVHQKVPDNMCRYCRTTFENVTLVQEHIKAKHSRKYVSIRTRKMVACKECGVKKQSAALLQEHMGMHTGDKKYKCPECGKLFCYARSLRKHMPSHSTLDADEFKSSCPICHKPIRQQAYLKTHMLIHEGTKPHECTECEMRFRQISHLNYHMLMHNGVRNHVCPHCSRAFALKGNLTVHIRKHTGETPYVCEVCNKGYYDSSSLKRHKQTQHRIGLAKKINNGIVEAILNLGRI